MWRLFKEVFKSLSKNKVMVIGLSILVFLTSAIFTLLTSVKNSMTRSFENYKNFSKLHDINVDLNLPNNGFAFNGGYFINGESSYELNTKENNANYSPIEYSIDFEKSFHNSAFLEWKKQLNQTQQIELDNIINSYKNDSIGTNTLSFENINTDFIPTNNIKHKDLEQFKNLYFAKSDLQNFFNNSNFLENIILNINDINNPYFKIVNTNFNLNLYELTNNNQYKKKQTKKIIDLESLIVFDKDYQINDLLRLTTDNANNILASQVSPIFINVYTNIATLNFSLGNKWIDEQQAIRIEPIQIMKLLGFDKVNNDNYLYKKIENKDLSNILMIAPFDNFDSSTKFRKEFFAKLLIDENNNYVNSDLTYKFITNENYGLDQNWIINLRSKNNFLRTNYYISYVDKLLSSLPKRIVKEDNSIEIVDEKIYAKDLWTGSYKTFIENLGSSEITNRNLIWDDIEIFSYWTKKRTETGFKYIYENNQWKLQNKPIFERETIAQLNPNFDFLDLNFVKLFTNDKRTLPITNENRNKYFIEQINSMNIKEIEKYNNPYLKDDLLNNDIEFYNSISQQNVKDKKFEIIQNNSLKFTRNSIVDKIEKLVGKDNIGLRRTITVDAVDNDGAKNVYHFINAGDDKREIEGIELNVGKLYNELFNSTALNNFPTHLNIFNTFQVPPIVAAKLILEIQQNQYVNKNYIETVIDYVNIYDNNIYTGEISNLTNKKIVWLNKYQQNQNQIKKHDDLPNYKELNLAIYEVDKKFFLVKEIIENNQIKYYSLYPNQDWEKGVSINYLNKWFEDNNLTIATKYIRTEDTGWVKYSNDKAYIPLAFVSIKNELNQLVLKNNSIEPLVKEGEKIIVDLDIVKKGYIKSNIIYKIIPLLETALDDVNLASVLTTGKIYSKTINDFLTKIIFYLTNHNSGDLLNILINDFIDAIKKEISTIKTLEKQKEYLAQQIDNLFLLFNKLNNSKSNQNYNYGKIFVNYINDPVKFFDFIQEIINSIDTKNFAKQLLNWYQENIKSETQEIFSLNRILNLLIPNIKAKNLQIALLNLIDNLNFENLLANNTNSLINTFLTNYNWNSNLYSIINKLKINNSFDNFKNGLKNIINYFDFFYFIEQFNTNFKLINSNNDNKFNILYLDKAKLITLSIESLFHAIGSDKGFKENIITFLNLSGKTTSFNYDNQTVWIPAKDDEKISFYDLLSLLNQDDKSNNVTNKNENQINSSTRNLILEFLSLKNNLTKNNLDTIEFRKLTVKEQNLLNFYLNINSDFNKTYIVDKIDKIILFLNQAIGGVNFITDTKLKTGADLLNDAKNFYSGNSFRLLLKSIIDNLIPTKQINQYSIANQAFNLFTPYLKMYQLENVTFEETNKFVKDFIEFAISNEILALSKQEDNNTNIPFNNSTNYSINKFINQPLSIDIFELNINNEFKNLAVKQLIDINPKFKNFVLTHQLELILQLGYFAQSVKYSSIDVNNPKTSAYYILINNFIENYLQTSEFFDIRFIAVNLANQINTYLPTDIIGISSTLLNPVLRLLFPEIALSYLVSQTQTSINDNNQINGNLAYLVLNKITNLEILGQKNSPTNTLLYEELSQHLNKEFNQIQSFKEDNGENITIDFSWFEHTKNLNTKPIFGIDVLQIQYDVLNKIFEEINTDYVAFQLPKYFLSKVNFAFLANNNKKIYNGTIPTDILLPNWIGVTKDFTANIPEEYLININGLKFIIIGEETTVDYMYPVIDENNLQVDTKHQALVYVNNLGFDRVKAAYAGNVVKDNLLVKVPENSNIKELKNEIKTIVDNSIVNANNIERVFLNNETDLINPERALRINTITNIIKIISVSTTALVLLFSFLVIVSIIFIIQRYINSKNKVLGILIAQGYTRTQIALSLSVFAITTAIIGGAIGYAIGNRMQFLVLETFSGYWTLPKNTLLFNPIAAVLTIVTPCFIMATIIYIITLISLRIKPLTLINGSQFLPTKKLFYWYSAKISKFNIKTRFSFILSYIGIWKLLSFVISVILVTTSALFGVSNRGVFNNTINLTYNNRNYKYKLNLQTPTIEAGLYKTFNGSNLKNLLYTPLGSASEIQQELWNYLAPGYSPIVNADNKNGNPTILDPHVITQFSLDLTLASGVSINPWDISYNSLPDTQKSKIDSSRKIVGNLLEETQNNKIIDKNKYIFINNPNKNDELLYVNENNHSEIKNYFKFTNLFNDNNGHFVYMQWNGKEYNAITLTTDLRNEYREFLVEAYKELQNKIDQETLNSNLIKTEPTINDYFISFSGVYFDKNMDETFTYIQTNKGYINGYNLNSKYVKLTDSSNNDLFDRLKQYNKENVYPLIINEVVAKKNKWKEGQIIDLEIQNHTNRYLDKILDNKRELTYQFEIVGINSTFINEEMITSQSIANNLTGLKDIVPSELNNFVPFNGILTNSNTPKQIINSTSLYSPSNYWSILTSFNTTDNDASAMYKSIFDPHGGLFVTNLQKNNFSLQEAQEKLINFLEPNIENNNKDVDNIFEANLTNAKDIVNRFANIYDNTLYSLLASNLDAKDIEVSFVSKIGQTVNDVTTGIIWITILISLTILVIISTIIINENKKNIAIWSILGYSEKEKIRMFFSIFIPFIILAILISIPAVLLLIYLFNIFMLQAGSIALMISLKFSYLAIVSLTFFIIFLITTFLTWYSIGKIKAIQLLKG
ncbi:ABC transporter permease [Mycoplasma sp. 744]|uniref:ABC transporter permease n=1 Tax=Mycoplasma sp. 744 TaxID=3108531 RepID=UPI002B1E64ED|nr:ABC transporter permease [Mycoplasma sp. 744]MEA4115359.1 ABC transporter permease [Mycoplasma sp. 744]